MMNRQFLPVPEFNSFLFTRFTKNKRSTHGMLQVATQSVIKTAITPKLAESTLVSYSLVHFPITSDAFQSIGSP